MLKKAEPNVSMRDVRDIHIHGSAMEGEFSSSLLKYTECTFCDMIMLDGQLAKS